MSYTHLELEKKIPEGLFPSVFLSLQVVSTNMLNELGRRWNIPSGHNKDLWLSWIIAKCKCVHSLQVLFCSFSGIF